MLKGTAGNSFCVKGIKRVRRQCCLIGAADNGQNNQFWSFTRSLMGRCELGHCHLEQDNKLVLTTPSDFTKTSQSSFKQAETESLNKIK